MNVAFCAHTMEFLPRGPPNPLTGSHQGDVRTSLEVTQREVHYAKGDCLNSGGSEVIARSEELKLKS